MSNNDSPIPIAAASEMWDRLVKEGVLRPKNYDKDIDALLQTQLPGSQKLPLRMDAASWTARDLLRAISPVVDSFAGLMRDLLALYTDVAATHATAENLTLSYEFDEGDEFDQSLAQFRSTVATLERAQAARGSFVLPPISQPWNYPSATVEVSDNGDVQALREGPREEWKFTLPVLPEAANSVVARGVSLVYGVLAAACDTLRNYGSTMHAVSNNAALHSRDELAGGGAFRSVLRLH